MITFSLSNSFSQDGYQIIPKNVISFETGSWSSGQAGLGYCRNFRINEKIHFSTELSGGVGVNWWTDVSYMANFCPMINIQKRNRIFMAGIQGRYYAGSLSDIDWSWFGPFPIAHFGPVNSYYGFTASPVIGFSKYSDNGFCFRLKLSALLPFRNGVIDRFRPSIGMSFGYAF